MQRRPQGHSGEKSGDATFPLKQDKAQRIERQPISSSVVAAYRLPQIMLTCRRVAATALARSYPVTTAKKPITKRNR